MTVVPPFSAESNSVNTLLPWETYYFTRSMHVQRICLAHVLSVIEWVSCDWKNKVASEKMAKNLLLEVVQGHQ